MNHSDLNLKNQIKVIRVIYVYVFVIQKMILVL
jgi:hypothetical protein